MDFQTNFKQFLSTSSQSEKENLTQKEMEDLQEAINKSKESACIEQHQRDFDRQTTEIQKHFYPKEATSSDTPEEPVREKTFTPKNWSKGSKSSVDITKIKDDFFGEEFRVTFQDLPETSGKFLDIIYHNPVFERPITLNPHSLTRQEKAQILYKYYTKLDHLQAQLAKESLLRAPYPKPILASNKCTSSLSKNGVEDENGSLDDFMEQSAVPDLYVSRSGRQVKRRIYTEDIEGDSDPDFAFTNKKNRVDTDVKITLDSPYIPAENQGEEKSEAKTSKVKKDTPRRANLGMKRLGHRSDAITDKLIQDGDKRKQQQDEMESFERTLPTIDEDDDNWLVENSPGKDAGDDGNFIRKRVVPPLPTKKMGRPKKTPKPEETDKIETIFDSPPGSPVLKRYSSAAKPSETKTRRKLKSQKSIDSAPSEEIAASKLEKVPCPICDVAFLQSEIANHASNCGIENPVDDAPQTSWSSAKKIKCELCEREFAMNTDYEVHVKQCIAAKVTDL